MYPSPHDKQRRNKLKMSGTFLRLLRRCAPPKEIDGFCCGRIEITTVAALLRNDIRGLFSFLCILRIRSGARNEKVSKWPYPILFGCSSTAKKDFDLRVMNHIPLMGDFRQGSPRNALRRKIYLFHRTFRLIVDIG